MGIIRSKVLLARLIGLVRLRLERRFARQKRSGESESDMNTISESMKEGIAPDVPSADAVVFFGATGDLAHKKIFPALQSLAKRGNLDIPVIGVAKAGWTLDQLEVARAGQRRTVRRFGPGRF